MTYSENSLKRKIILTLGFCTIILTCFFSMRLYIASSWTAYIFTEPLPNNKTFIYPGEIFFKRDSNQSNNDTNLEIDGQVLPKTNATLEENAHAKTQQASKEHVIVTSNELKKSSTVRIGILIPSSTQKIKNPVLKKLSLTTLCLPSLFKTFEKDYVYQIYIGIDKGDYLESVQDELTKLFSNITVVTVASPVRTFTRSVNAIARKAYEAGMDYLVRINDDTSFETKLWTSSALDILLKYKPPNIGVVGPACKEGNTHILTHDMVHRTHVDIFGFYYPLYFDNWWSDDWITKVYQPDRSTKLSSWIVKHHMGFHGTRYRPDMKKMARLEQIISYDRAQVTDYLKNTEKSSPD